MIFAFEILVLWAAPIRWVIAQTPAITSEVLPVSAEKIRAIKIWSASGFLPKVDEDLISVSSLNLTDDQMALIKKLKDLSNDLTSMGAHNNPESMPIDQMNVKSKQKEGIEKADQLGNELGDGKTDDLCQWIREEAMINGTYSKLTWHKGGLKNANELTDQIFKKITGSKIYGEYKDRKIKTFGSKSTADQYFLNREKRLKLRISYKQTVEQYHKTNLSLRGNRQELEKKSKEILNELKSSEK